MKTTVIIDSSKEVPLDVPHHILELYKLEPRGHAWNPGAKKRFLEVTYIPGYDGDGWGPDINTITTVCIDEVPKGSQDSLYVELIPNVDPDRIRWHDYKECMRDKFIVIPQDEPTRIRIQNTNVFLEDGAYMMCYAPDSMLVDSFDVEHESLTDPEDEMLECFIDDIVVMRRVRKETAKFLENNPITNYER